VSENGGPRPNYISPDGFAALRAEYDQLLGHDRPAIVEIVSWAAGNGDRSENGDYIYGRKRMREIDRRLGWLAKRMKAAKIVDPAQAPDQSRVWFGATVTIADEEDNQRTLTLVGNDEAAAGEGRIGWDSPLARALRGGAVGDVRRVILPSNTKAWEILTITYPHPFTPSVCDRGRVGV
jgi:transcription elongation factor GreB